MSSCSQLLLSFWSHFPAVRIKSLQLVLGWIFSGTLQVWAWLCACVVRLIGWVFWTECRSLPHGCWSITVSGLRWDGPNRPCRRKLNQPATRGRKLRAGKGVNLATKAISHFRLRCFSLRSKIKQIVFHQKQNCISTRFLFFSTICDSTRRVLFCLDQCNYFDSALTDG